MIIGFKYGSFVLQDPPGGITVTKTDVMSPPVNEIQADTLAEADGALVVKQQFKSKTFKIEGFMGLADRAALLAKRDALVLALFTKNQAFDVEDANGVRRYLANAQNLVISDSGLTRIAFSAQFLSADGMAWDSFESTFFPSTPIASGSASLSVSPRGTYQIEPKFTIIFSAISGGAGKSVSLANSSTLRGMRITRNWAAGDVLEVDSQKKTVFVNNVAVDFEGQFPVFSPLGEPLSYLDDFTSRTASATGTFTARWLS